MTRQFANTLNDPRQPLSSSTRDPLEEGQPCTWRLLLINVAASVVSARRLVMRLFRRVVTRG